MQLSILIALGVTTGCMSQNKNKADLKSVADSIKAQLNLKDSIRILKIDSIQNSIAFIDYNQTSRFHSELLESRGTNIFFDYYNEEYQRQRKTFGAKTASLQSTFTNKWIQLYRYQGTFYVYMDCEFQMVYQTTDSTFVRYYMDGASPALITSISSGPTYVSITTSLQDVITIKSIKNNIYQLKLNNECLFVTPSSSVNHFPIIVHYCNDETDDIISFEKNDCD